MTMGTHITPADLEARLAGPVDRATVEGLIAVLHDDGDWEVVELCLDGRLAHVELTYGPTGEVFSLTERRDRPVS